MNLLQYEFIEGPDDSINGMRRTLVKELRVGLCIATEEFKKLFPLLRDIEYQLQTLDAEISQPKRSYIEEIMEELNQESEMETNIVDDLNRAPIVITNSILGQEINMDDFLYTIGKSEHYHWLQFSGYTDQRAIDANLLIVREVFRSICNKYNYIFIDLS
jgi:hypothetical protein